MEERLHLFGRDFPRRRDVAAGQGRRDAGDRLQRAGRTRGHRRGGHRLCRLHLGQRRTGRLAHRRAGRLRPQGDLRRAAGHGPGLSGKRAPGLRARARDRGGLLRQGGRNPAVPRRGEGTHGAHLLRTGRSHGGAARGLVCPSPYARRLAGRIAFPGHTRPAGRERLRLFRQQHGRRHPPLLRA